MKNTIDLKVVLLGDADVGKTSIISRYATSSFNKYEEPTIGAAYIKKVVKFKGKLLKFNIWDTAGQERYHTLAKLCYRDSKVAILVYDITNYNSFLSVRRWHQELTEHAPSDVIKILVGNKQDLVHREAVANAEAERYGKAIGAGTFRASAKEDSGIVRIFTEIQEKTVQELMSTRTPRVKTVVLQQRSKKQRKC